MFGCQDPDRRSAETHRSGDRPSVRRRLQRRERQAAWPRCWYGSCCRWIRSCSARKFKWAISSSSSRISRVSQQKGLLGNLPRARFPCCTLWRRDWPASRDNLGSGSSTRTLLDSGFGVQVRWEMVLVQSTPSQRRCKFGGVKRTDTTAKPCGDCAEYQSDGPEQSAP